MLRLCFAGGNSLFSVGSPEVATFGAGAGWRKARPVSGELRLRNGAAEKRINGGCQVGAGRRGNDYLRRVPRKPTPPGAGNRGN